MTGKQILIVAAVLACLVVVVGTVLAATQAPVRGEREGSAPSGYHLTSLSWQTDKVLTGTGYRLETTITGTGTQCCCVHLPCVFRNYP